MFYPDEHKLRTINWVPVSNICVSVADLHTLFNGILLLFMVWILPERWGGRWTQTFTVICCTLHLYLFWGSSSLYGHLGKLGTIGFITTKIITCQEGVCWKLMTHKGMTGTTHASTFLVKLTLVNISAMEEPDPDTGAASRAVEAGASSLQSNAHPGSDRTYHSTSFQPIWEPFPEGMGDSWASSQWASSIKSCTHEMLKPGTCLKWTVVSEAKNPLRHWTWPNTCDLFTQIHICPDAYLL